MKAAVALLALCLVSPLTAPAAHAAGGSACERELDRHVADARAGHVERAERGLLALQLQCNQLPHIRHDLGSLAARRGDWDAAIEHLEAAIALDERTADTVAALRDIQRWRAAHAYAEALGEPRPRLAPPIPSLHDSRRVNADAGRTATPADGSDRPPAGGTADAPGSTVDRAPDPALQDEQLVDLQLQGWWTSAAGNRPDDHNAHYAADFEGDTLASSSLTTRRPDWASVTRDVAFTRQDAVVLVRWGADAASRHERLLLLRPENGRWTIYEERVL